MGGDTVMGRIEALATRLLLVGTTKPVPPEVLQMSALRASSLLPVRFHSTELLGCSSQRALR